MTIHLDTLGDVRRYTAKRVVVTASLSLLITTIALLMDLGTDLDATVRVGEIIGFTDPAGK